MGYARLQHAPFRLDDVVAELSAHAPTGGVTAYVGTVRGDDGGRPIDALTYEAYAEMATEVLERLRQDTVRRFGLVDAIVIHRLGTLRPGDPILVVALAGVHREETYDAVRHFMHRLKEDVPIWKKEHASDGQRWILGPARPEATP